MQQRREVVKSIKNVNETYENTCYELNLWETRVNELIETIVRFKHPLQWVGCSNIVYKTLCNRIPKFVYLQRKSIIEKYTTIIDKCLFIMEEYEPSNCDGDSRHSCLKCERMKKTHEYTIQKFKKYRRSINML